jgi:hypothetical protein
MLWVLSSLQDSDGLHRRHSVLAQGKYKDYATTEAVLEVAL